MATYKELAADFKSGSGIPMYEKMLEEILEHGVQESPKFTHAQNLAFAFGSVVGQIGNLPLYTDRQDYGWLDDFVYCQNPKKPYEWAKTLQKPKLAERVLELPEYWQEVFAVVCGEEKATDEIDGPAYLAGVFRQRSKKKAGARG